MADFGVNASAFPSFVFAPVAGVAATCKLTNLGTSTLYAGPLNTLLTPGAYPAGIGPRASLYLNPCTASVYMTAGFVAGTSKTTLSAASSTAGSSSFTVASNANFPAGTLLLLGSVTSSQEVLVVASTTSTTIVTTTLPSLYDHVASSTVSTATATPGQARVLTGVI